MVAEDDADGARMQQGHRWSGWPGAFCLNCGAEDRTELCVGAHDHAVLDPERGICVVPCQNEPCPEPRSGRFDPYRRAR